VAGYTKMVYRETVTYPNINRARRRVTPLIETKRYHSARPQSINQDILKVA